MNLIHRKLVSLFFISPLLLSLMAAVLFLTGCKEAKRTYSIGISQCSTDDWRSKMNAEIERELLFHPEIHAEIVSADDDNNKQINQIRQFIRKGVDILIVSPNEAEALTPVISEAYRKGIKVLVFDRQVIGDDYTTFIGADNYGIGKQAAHSAAEAAKGKNLQETPVLELYGRMASTPARERHRGFAEQAALEGMPESIGVEAFWDYDVALQKADSLFNVYPDAAVVYAHNDRMALGARAAARKHGIDPYIIGIDAAPNIGIKAVADNDIDVTFLYPTEGHRIIRTALDILNGKPTPHSITLPTSSPVDITNADVLLWQNDNLMEETSRMQQLKNQLDEYWEQHSAQRALFFILLAMLALVCLVLFLVLRMYWQRKRWQLALMEQNRELEHQRDVQEQLNEQLNEATRSKLTFFTNVSHDLRTPLTLIAEPVEQLGKADNLTPRQHTLVQLASKNVKILQRLINQILDFRKFENQKLTVNLLETNIALCLGEWCASFDTIARKRDIKLNVDLAQDIPAMAVDVEKMERIVFNLMSNAFKFTPDNGKITVKAFMHHEDGSGDCLKVQVADNGRGINEEDIKKIFDRFYQVETINPNGSGIGLALCKAFAEVQGGSLTVESAPGVGSTFTLTIPVKHVETTAETPPSASMLSTKDVEAELGEIEGNINNEGNGRPLLLIIDDNADIRKMVKELMADDYDVISATNGQEGLKMAAKYVPDLIICDVMMPVMDGLECSRRLKKEISTSHIPVLMLTACSTDDQRVEGYESGADGYISKPFSISVFTSRVKNLIENRRLIKNLWKAEPASAGNSALVDKTGVQDKGEKDGKAVSTKEKRAEEGAKLKHGAMVSGSLGDIESEFYHRFLSIVKNEMGDPTLNVDSLAGKMGLGRSQFYRKIKALTNYSPVELLRRLRLNAAREALLTTEKSVSEIAYEVGFSTPAYFTKCYREAFGETPTELRDKMN